MKAAAICLLASAVLAGCATTDLPPDSIAQFAAAPNRVQLTVDRSWNFLGGACVLDIFVDNRLAARLGNGDSGSIWVEPGHHNVRGQTRGCMSHHGLETDIAIQTAVTLRVIHSIRDFGAFAFDQ